MAETFNVKTNLLIERLLPHSGYRWDPSTFEWMSTFFKSQPQAHKEQFIEASKAMKNAKFEQTVYWGIVAGFVVKRDKRCRFCANPEYLVVHHTTYMHRGLEHLHLEDLETLCSSCHLDRHMDNSAKGAVLGMNPGLTLEEIIAERSGKALNRRVHARLNIQKRSPHDDPEPVELTPQEMDQQIRAEYPNTPSWLRNLA